MMVRTAVAGVSPRVDAVTVPGNPTPLQALRPLRGRLRRAWTAVGTPSKDPSRRREERLAGSLRRPGAARTRPRFGEPRVRPQYPGPGPGPAGRGLGSPAGREQAAL